MKRLLNILMLGCCILSITSCESPKDVIYLQDLTADKPLNIPPVQLIRVKPEDKLNINVHCRDENISSLFNVGRGGSYRSSWGSNTSTGSSYVDLHAYVVNEGGDIEFPILGTIHVSGLTRQEVANTIRDLLVERNLVKDPYVSCSFATAYYYTIGEISGRGQIQMPKDACTIIEAIAQCGDFNLQGVRTNVRVFREVNGQLHSYDIDFTNAEQVVNSPVYYIQPNDIIYVQPTRKRQFETTALGNSVRTPSFWMGTLGTVISLGLTVYTLVRRI